MQQTAKSSLEVSIDWNDQYAEGQKFFIGHLELLRYKYATNIERASLVANTFYVVFIKCSAKYVVDWNRMNTLWSAFRK